MEEESLFVNEMPIEILIATNDSKNRRNEEIFEGAASRQISDNENSPVNSILIEI